MEILVILLFIVLIILIVSSRNRTLGRIDLLEREIVRLDSELTIIHAVTGTKPGYEHWVEFTSGIVQSLLSRFFVQAEDGTYRHEGWDRELSKAQRLYESRKRGGLNSSLIKNQVQAHDNNQSDERDREVTT